MYLYFSPILSSTSDTHSLSLDFSSSLDAASVPIPSTDGGIEHTTASFLHPSAWLSLAESGSIILFPPQFYLLHFLSQFFVNHDRANISHPTEIRRQRASAMEALKTGSPSLGDRCISPYRLFVRKSDGTSVLGLDRPGFELKGSERRGDNQRVILVKSGKEGPRQLAMRWRDDVLRDETSELSSEKL